MNFNRSHSPTILAWKLFCLALPLVVTTILELYVLPFDFFTFRAWEPLSVKNYTDQLRGPFYPGQLLRLVEEGDLAHGTKLAQPKSVIWQTDRQGFRNRPMLFTEHWSTVIVGDSTAAGTSLDQKDMIGSRLESEFGIGTYTYAPSYLTRYLNDDRFLGKTPEYIVVETIERSIDQLPPISIDAPASLGYDRFVPPSYWVLLDRMRNSSFLYYIRAQIRSGGKREILGMIPGGAKMVFLQGPAAFKKVDDSKIYSSVELLKTYKAAVEKKGSKFVFLPVPNKESVYFRDFPGQKEPPDFLPRLIDALRKEGIPVVDTWTAFQSYASQNESLIYHLDDSHWNSVGSGIAASLLADTLNSMSNSQSRTTNRPRSKITN